MLPSPLQLEPKELSEQLKRQGASIPAVRPGRATAEYITKTLDRMSVLGGWARGAAHRRGGRQRRRCWAGSGREA